MVFSCTDPNIIIFEDILPEKFEMIQTPLNKESLIMVMKKLGKFHALTYYMNDQHEEVENYKEGFVSGKLLANNTFLQDNFNAFADEIGLWRPKYTAVAEKLVKLKPTFVERLKPIYTVTKPGIGYNVLNHGDFHIKNMLFKKTENGSLDAVRFVRKII